jgi:hypothetical protein
MRRPWPTGALEPKTDKNVVGPLLISYKVSEDCIFRMNSKRNYLIVIKSETDMFLKYLAV